MRRTSLVIVSLLLCIALSVPALAAGELDDDAGQLPTLPAADAVGRAAGVLGARQAAAPDAEAHGEIGAGQRKRAGLARLIGQGARHWLLDEPLNGLDDAGVALVEALIAERRTEGGAVIVASHQPIALPGAAVLDLRNHRA